MAKVSLSQAAKDNDVSLPTLSRWRKLGKISADKNGSGGYIIDTSEYDRIKELKKKSPNMKHSMKEEVKDFATPNESRVLQVEVEVLRERIKDKNGMIEGLKEDRDEWKKQAQTLLLQSSSIRQPHSPQEASQEISGINPRKPTEKAISGKVFTHSATYLLLALALGTLGFIFWLTNSNQHLSQQESESTLLPANKYTPPEKPNPTLSYSPKPEILLPPNN
jgi:hypothetical protein